MSGGRGALCLFSSGPLKAAEIRFPRCSGPFNKGDPCVKLQGSFPAASRASPKDIRSGSEEMGAFWTWAIPAHSAADGYRNR